jgi:hypothetical protein
VKAQAVWRRGMLGVLLACAIEAPVALAQPAQPDDASLPAALGGIRLDKRVRILTRDEQWVDGRYLGLRNDSLFVASGMEETGTAAADIRGLWTRERATWRGARVGGVVVGVAGGVVTPLFMYLLSQLCDTGTCDDDFGTGDYVAGALLGGLGGGLMGGLAGGLIGAAVPLWKLSYHATDATVGSPEAGELPESVVGIGPGAGDRPGDSEERIAVPLEDRQGGYGLCLGVMGGAADCAQGAVPYARAMLHVNVSPVWTLLPEVGFTLRNVRQTYAERCGSGDSAAWCKSSMSTSIRHIGLAARYSFGAGSRRPFVTGGVGGYIWNESFLGYHAGGGVALAADSRHPIEIELRWHAKLQRLVEDCPSQMVSATVGIMPATW